MALSTEGEDGIRRDRGTADVVAIGVDGDERAPEGAQRRYREDGDGELESRGAPNDSGCPEAGVAGQDQAGSAGGRSDAHASADVALVLGVLEQDDGAGSAEDLHKGVYRTACDAPDAGALCA